MTNLEGRVLRRRKAIDAARGRAQRPVRSWPSWPRGWARPAPSRTDPAEVFDELAPRQRRRAAPTTRASATSGSTPSDGAVLAVPRRRRRPPGHAAAVPRLASPPRTAGPGSSPSTTAARPTTCAPTHPCYLATGRVLAHYQSGAQTRRVADAGGRRARSRSSSCTRCLADAARHRRRASAVRVTTPRGAVAAPGPASPTTIRPDTVFMPFHWGGPAAPTASPTTPSTRSPGCRSSRSARSTSRPRPAPAATRWRQRMTNASSSSATAWSAPGSSRTCSPRTAPAGFDVTVARRRGLRALQPGPAHRGRRRPVRPRRAHAARTRPTAGSRCCAATTAVVRRPRGPGRRVARTAAGTATTALVLATGAARARSRRSPGLRPDRRSLPRGVHALRTIDDAREIVAATLNARRAVVLGGGVLGLEAACGLAGRGVAVTVVHPASRPDGAPARQRGRRGRRARRWRGLGIDHRVGVGAEEVAVAGRRHPRRPARRRRGARRRPRSCSPPGPWPTPPWRCAPG